MKSFEQARKKVGQNATGSRLKHFAVADLFVAAALVSGAAFAFPMIAQMHPDTVVVFRDNRQIAQYPLEKPITFKVAGATGPVGIEISNKTVRVTSSNCPHQICAHAGSIGTAHQQIICAPNHIMVTIRNTSGEQKLDATAR